MSFEKVTYIDDETVIGAKNLNDIQDSIISFDKALNIKEYDIIKSRQSSNLFDKNTYEFDNDFYVGNVISNKNFVDQGTYGGGGWKNIPVESGKSYVLCINNTVTLTDMNNIEYGVFMNTWFLDAKKKGCDVRPI